MPPRDLKAAIGIGDIQDLAKKWQTLNNFQVAVKHTCVKRCKAKVKSTGANVPIAPMESMPVGV